MGSGTASFGARPAMGAIRPLPDTSPGCLEPNRSSVYCGFCPGSLIARSPWFNSKPFLVGYKSSVHSGPHASLKQSAKGCSAVLDCTLFLPPPASREFFSEPVPRPCPVVTGSPLGGILGSFWLQFGPSGGSCSSFFGVHVCFFWLAARLLLVLFFSCVLSSVARLLSYQATRHSSPKR